MSAITIKHEKQFFSPFTTIQTIRSFSSTFCKICSVELKDLIVCIVVNGEKFQSPTMTLTLIRQCPLSNLSEIFSYTTKYPNFMFRDCLLLSDRANTHTHACTHTHTHTHRLTSTCTL